LMQRTCIPPAFKSDGFSNMPRSLSVTANTTCIHVSYAERRTKPLRRLQHAGCYFHLTMWNILVSVHVTARTNVHFLTWSLPKSEHSIDNTQDRSSGPIWTPPLCGIPLSAGTVLTFNRNCMNVYFFISWGGVRLNALGTAATVWHILPAPVDTWWWIGRGNWSTRKKPAPVLLCPPQIPHDLLRAIWM
jgi:hypothetical protein